MDIAPKQIFYLKIFSFIFAIYWGCIAFFSLGFLIIAAADSGISKTLFIGAFSFFFLVPIIISLVFLFITKIRKRWVYFTALTLSIFFELFLLPSAFLELRGNPFSGVFIGIIPFIIASQRLIAFVLIGIIISLLLKKQVREYYLNKQI